jgi:tetratricopeptide (TPR) repeat protein
MKISQNCLGSRRAFALVPLVLLCIGIGFAAPLENTSEAGPESPPSPGDTNETLRVSLLLQEQLHATQLALERNRQESEALAAAVAARVKALEDAVNSQRDDKVDAMQQRMDSLRKDLESNNKLLLKVGGGIAVIGFFVLLATGYLQWRAVNRLAEFSTLVQSARAALPATVTSPEAALLGAGAPAQANSRLFGALTDLEKRIHELEHSTHASAESKALTAGTGTNGTEGLLSESGHASHDSLLLAKGQSLLNLDKTTEALACFDEILQVEPNHGEALVKKGIVLEQLNQSDEALRCYDQAIAANADLTIAYLQKGGLFNRLERYEEALQCYEQALHAQEKAHQV